MEKIKNNDPERKTLALKKLELDLRILAEIKNFINDIEFTKEIDIPNVIENFEQEQKSERLKLVVLTITTSIEMNNDLKTILFHASNEDNADTLLKAIKKIEKLFTRYENKKNLNFNLVTFDDRKTLFHKACEDGQESIMSKVLVVGTAWNTFDQKYFYARTLIDVNLQDANGNTGLHLACKNLHETIVQHLAIYCEYAAGVDMNIKNNDGYTPLDIAMSIQPETEEQKKKQDEIIALLKQADAVTDAFQEFDLDLNFDEFDDIEKILEISNNPNQIGNEETKKNLNKLHGEDDVENTSENKTLDLGKIIIKNHTRNKDMTANQQYKKLMQDITTSYQT